MYPEEKEARELQAQVDFLRKETIGMEDDLRQVKDARDATLAFYTSRERFLQFDHEVTQQMMKCAKKRSLSLTDPNPERSVFAIQVLFLREQVKGCERYRDVLLEVLRHPQTAENYKPKRRTLTEVGKTILSRWFEENQHHPFPTAAQKEELAQEVGAPVEQISTWFTNARSRRGRNKRARFSSD